MRRGTVIVMVIDSELSGRGATRTEDAQGTPTQTHISPSILVYEAKQGEGVRHLSDKSRGSLVPQRQVDSSAHLPPASKVAIFRAQGLNVRVWSLVFGT